MQQMFITVDETFSSPVQPTKKSVDCNWEEVQRIDQQLQQDRMDESEKKRKAEEDLSAIKVYKKQKTRRTLSTAIGYTRTWYSKCIRYPSFSSH